MNGVPCPCILCLLFYSSFMILKLTALTFQTFLCETQKCFYWIKFGYSCHLRRRNYGEMLAAILHDNLFPGDRAMGLCKSRPPYQNSLFYIIEVLKDRSD